MLLRRIIYTVSSGSNMSSDTIPFGTELAKEGLLARGNISLAGKDVEI